LWRTATDVAVRVGRVPFCVTAAVTVTVYVTVGRERGPSTRFVHAGRRGSRLLPEINDQGTDMIGPVKLDLVFFFIRSPFSCGRKVKATRDAGFSDG
jgi:hypothetical protein